MIYRIFQAIRSSAYLCENPRPQQQSALLLKADIGYIFICVFKGGEDYHGS
jgi:hypothetical protein